MYSDLFSIRGVFYRIIDFEVLKDKEIISSLPSSVVHHTILVHPLLNVYSPNGGLTCTLKLVYNMRELTTILDNNVILNKSTISTLRLGYTILKQAHETLQVVLHYL